MRDIEIIGEVIISSHQREKHGESITDELILELIQTQIDGEEFGPDKTSDGYS